MSGKQKREEYIVFKGWSDFQHYGTRANVTWVKNYTALLKDDAYLELPLPTRGLLHSLWLLNATTTSPISARTSYLYRAIGQRVLTTQLKLLNQAGFIEFTASKELARRKQRASKPLAQKKSTSYSSKSARDSARAGLRAAPESEQEARNAEALSRLAREDAARAKAQRFVYQWKLNGQGVYHEINRVRVADQTEADLWVKEYGEAGQTWTLTPTPPEEP